MTATPGIHCRIQNGYAKVPSQLDEEEMDRVLAQASILFTAPVVVPTVMRLCRPRHVLTYAPSAYVSTRYLGIMCIADDVGNQRSLPVCLGG